MLLTVTFIRYIYIFIIKLSQYKVTRNSKTFRPIVVVQT